jgi:hypothetical protein
MIIYENINSLFNIFHPFNNYKVYKSYRWDIQWYVINLNLFFYKIRLTKHDVYVLSNYHQTPKDFLYLNYNFLSAIYSYNLFYKSQSMALHLNIKLIV